MHNMECYSQYDGYSNEELPSSSVLLSVVNLFPVGQPACVPLVPCYVGGPLQIVEHDIHPLRGRQQ